MALKYPGEWKFEGVGFQIPPRAAFDFFSLLLEIASPSKDLVESFKGCFGVTSTSTSYDWAATDLRAAMDAKVDNAATFVDAVWKCIEVASEEGVAVPRPVTVNNILSQHGVPLSVELPDLVRLEQDIAIRDAGDASGSAGQGGVPVFVLGDEIGKGGYGIVYTATRATTVGEFEYALKVLDPSPFVTDYEKALSRFRREVATMRVLQHRAIVPYFDGCSSRSAEKKQSEIDRLARAG